MKLTHTVAIASAIVVSGAASAMTFPGYTSIGGQWYSNVQSSSEPGHAAILDGIYGAGFGATGTLSFTNGSITATRLADATSALGAAGVALNLDGTNSGTSGVTDQIWQDGVIRTNAEAKYAGDTQTFGWRQGAGPGTNPLFTVNANGFISGVNATFGPVPGNGQFEWTRSGGADGLFSSDASDNESFTPPGGGTGDADHMVTYRITGTGITTPTFLVFFEDRINGDYDYNDLVVEISVVPVPAAALMGLAGLAGVGVVRRRFRQA
jgi:hypothetical protein